MRYIVALWIVWVVLALLLLSCILYRLHLIHDQEHHAAANGDDARPPDGTARLAKAARLQHLIRILGGIEGLSTLAIAGYYVLDALRQF